MGMVGSLKSPLDEKEFLDFVAKQFKSKSVRHSPLLGKPIQKVAVLGGSGSFAIEAAKATNANAFISADLKYHDFFTAEDQLLLIDVGHYESEQYTKNLLVSYLTKKIPNFTVVLSNINTNPVNIHTYG
jgi:putative NIF3 family GTP cyclohydrolase 1 type 2